MIVYPGISLLLTEGNDIIAVVYGRSFVPIIVDTHKIGYQTFFSDATCEWLINQAQPRNWGIT
jgi:hypothetical protein